MTQPGADADGPIEVDCLVLGGGITGAGVARDAAMRGLRTMLVDSHDFASGTSHVTSKLIHGGLRYLEHARFRLVYEGIVERDRLLNRLAPNLVFPLRFVIPHESHRFPKWLLTVAGLQLYGLIERCRAGRRSLPMSGALMARLYPHLLPHPFGVCFWDAQANDARLVLSTVRTAHSAGVALRNYTRVCGASFDQDRWCIRLVGDERDGEEDVRARVVVNATGPWSPATAKLLRAGAMDLMWIKGSHILLKRPPSFGNDAIIIRSVQNHRPLWVIPWRTRLIVGTTESHYSGDLRDVRPSDWEIADLLDSFNHYFPGLALSVGEVSGAYAGVRPIVKQDGASENELSRRHEITVDPQRKLLTITGGKLTTFRAMAEKSVDKIAQLLGRREIPTGLRQRLRSEPLWPAISPEQSDRIRGDVVAHLPRIEPELVDHWTRLYGRGANEIAAKVAKDHKLGERLFEGLPYCVAELLYLCETEYVVHLLDLVKRRTSMYFLAGRNTLEKLESILPALCAILHWDATRAADELDRVRSEFDADCRPIGRSAPPLENDQVAAYV